MFYKTFFMNDFSRAVQLTYHKSKLEHVEELSFQFRLVVSLVQAAIYRNGHSTVTVWVPVPELSSMNF